MKNILTVISILFLTACGASIDVVQIEKLNTICETNGSKAHWYWYHSFSNRKDNTAYVVCADGQEFSEKDYKPTIDEKNKD